MSLPPPINRKISIKHINTKCHLRKAMFNCLSVKALPITLIVVHITYKNNIILLLILKKRLLTAVGLNRNVIKYEDNYLLLKICYVAIHAVN